MKVDSFIVQAVRLEVEFDAYDPRHTAATIRGMAKAVRVYAGRDAVSLADAQGLLDDARISADLADRGL